MSSGPRSEPPLLQGYRHLGYLGGGGFADVFLYEQQRPSRQVAIKVLRSSDLDERAQRSFDAEGDLMARVSAHPNIVQIFGADVSSDGRPYLVMEYYPGRHLGDRLKQRPFPVAEVLQLGVRLASAVETAHRAGILHRDIKPANVLVSQYDHPGLADFGIAGSVGPGAQAASEGVSVPYAPPEIITDRSPGDVRSDVYSLAATLYALLAGRSPFEITGGDNTVAALAQRVINGPIPPIGREDVPVSLELLLSQALAKDPAQRPASAAELGRSLQGIERQMGHSPTEFQVATAAVAAAPQVPASEPDADDGTRAARIQVVHQPIDLPADATQARPGVVDRAKLASPPNPSSGPVYERLPAPEAPASPDTVARARPADPVPLSPEDANADDVGGRRGLWIAVAAGAALLAIVAIVVLMAVGGGGDGESATTTTEVIDEGALAIPDSPAIPTGVVVSLNGTTATVAWTAGNGAEPGDTYTVYRADVDATPVEATSSPMTFEVAVGDVPCFEVSSERGTRTSIEHSKKACAG